jgi:hypothetical protein
MGDATFDATCICSSVPIGAHLQLGGKFWSIKLIGYSSRNFSSSIHNAGVGDLAGRTAATPVSPPVATKFL